MYITCGLFTQWNDTLWKNKVGLWARNEWTYLRNMLNKGSQRHTRKCRVWLHLYALQEQTNPLSERNQNSSYLWEILIGKGLKWASWAHLKCSRSTWQLQAHIYANIYQAQHLGFVHFTIHVSYFITHDKKSRNMVKVCSVKDFPKIWYLVSWGFNSVQR